MAQDIDLLKTKPEDLKPLREDLEEYKRLKEVNDLVDQQYNLTERTVNNLEGQERKEAAEKSRELRYHTKSRSWLFNKLIVATD